MKLKTGEVSSFLVENVVALQRAWQEFAKAAQQGSPPHFHFVYEQLTQEATQFVQRLDASSLEASQKTELKELFAQFVQVKEVLFKKGSHSVALKFGAEGSSGAVDQKEIESLIKKGELLLSYL